MDFHRIASEKAVSTFTRKYVDDGRDAVTMAVYLPGDEDQSITEFDFCIGKQWIPMDRQFDQDCGVDDQDWVFWDLFHNENFLNHCNLKRADSELDDDWRARVKDSVLDLFDDLREGIREYAIHLEATGGLGRVFV